MARNFHRSFRLDDELKEQINALPYGSLNSLVNELLNRFFNDAEFRKTIDLKDDRFNNYEPKKLTPMLPGISIRETKPAAPLPRARRSVDDLMPGL